MSNLPANLIQLGSLNTGWPLWKSKVAGSIHWKLQSANGRSRRGAADARAMGITNGCGEKGHIERHVWFGHHVCPFSFTLFAQSTYTSGGIICKNFVLIEI